MIHHDDEHTLSHIGTAEDRRLLRRMLVFAGPHKAALIFTVVLLVIGLGLRLAGPWIVSRVIDGPIATAAELRAAGDLDLSALTGEVTRYALMFLGVTAFQAALLVLREWLMNRTGQRVVLSIRNALFHHVLRLPIAWFDRHHVGWTVTRTTSDVDALSELFTTGVATIAYDVLTIFVVVGVLVFISPSLSIVALLILPLMIMVSFRFRLKARLAYRATRNSLSKLNGFLQERLTGLDVVHIFRREKSSARRFDKLNTRYYDDNMVTVRHFSMFFPTVDALSWTVKMGTLTWGSWLLLEGELTLGTWVMFWLLLDFVFEPIRELAERYNVLQAAMAAGERIWGIYDAPQEVGEVPLSETLAATRAGVPQPASSGDGATPSVVAVPSPVPSPNPGPNPNPKPNASPKPSPKPSATPSASPQPKPNPTPTASVPTRDSSTPTSIAELPAGDGRLRDDAETAAAFDHVSFAYPTGPDVLEDVSFTIGRGERVAVVGHTGAGKTTLVSLLCRFHETERGAVRVLGADVRAVPHQELRRRIAIVQQDVFLFSDTIAANIRVGNAALSDERMREVARAVNADRFIDRLPDGYETRLLERGANLSTGQRQLLAFARALAADPDILVLDEATSSVDSETEHWIEEATATLLKGRSSLVIAHRLSTVVNADRIIVMHKGQLREQGTHEELLSARGLYHRLYHLHLAGTS